jgi:hypothetical protein
MTWPAVRPVRRVHTLGPDTPPAVRPQRPQARTPRPGGGPLTGPGWLAPATSARSPAAWPTGRATRAPRWATVPGHRPPGGLPGGTLATTTWPLLDWIQNHLASFWLLFQSSNLRLKDAEHTARIRRRMSVAESKIIVQYPASTSSSSHSEVADIMINAADDRKHEITKYGCPSLRKPKNISRGVEKWLSFSRDDSLTLASIAWPNVTTLARAMIGATVPINIQNDS